MEFTTFVDCNPQTKVVIKAVQVSYIPPDIPPFHGPLCRESNLLTYDDLSRPGYMDDQFFYLAFVPRTPFPVDEPNTPVTSCLQYPTMHALPVEHKSGSKRQWVLNAKLCEQWISFETLLDKASDALDPLVFNERPGVGTTRTVPVRARAVHYGYRDAAGDQWTMQKAAWLSRNMFCAMIAYLSFQLAVCRARDIGGWRKELQRATNLNFSNWACSCSMVSSYKPCTRRGGIMYPLQPMVSQRWQAFLPCFAFASIPVWIHYGPKMKTYEDQIRNTSVHSNIMLTHEEFLIMEAQLAGHAALVSREPPAQSLQTVLHPEPEDAVGDDQVIVDQSMKYPPSLPYSRQRRGESWQDFFARRDLLNAQQMLSENAKDRHARLQRLQANDGSSGQQPTKHSQVFIWVKADYPENYRLRTRVVKASVELEFMDRKGQRRYDSFADEWDICTEFGADDDRHDERFDEDEASEDELGYPKKFHDLFHTYENQPQDDAMDVDSDQSPPPPPPAAAAASVLPSTTPAALVTTPVTAADQTYCAVLPSHEATVSVVTTPREDPSPLVPSSVVAPSSCPDGAVLRERLTPDQHVEILVTAHPTKYELWVNPNTFSQVLQYHYGLVLGDKLQSEQPVAKVLLPLGWKRVTVPVALVEMARHLNCQPRPIHERDLSRVRSPNRVSRGQYVQKVWDRLPVRSGEFYAVSNLPGDDYPWLLVVHRASVITHILRRSAECSTADIVRELWLQGMPYSLYRSKASLPDVPSCVPYNEDLNLRDVSHGYVPTGIKAGIAEFQKYTHALEQFFNKPYRLRAAMQHGGLIWRIACQFANLEDSNDYFAGPDHYSRSHGGCPRFVQLAGREQEYWEDVLTDSELEFICGVYLDDTNSACSFGVGFLLCLPDLTYCNTQRHQVNSPDTSHGGHR